MSEPSLLTIETGTRCNNRCAFCPQHFLRIQALQTLELSTKQILQRMREGRQQHHRRIALTGGEPTVRADLVHLVKAAREMGYDEIGLTTNGRMLSSRDHANDLLDAGLNRLSFSLHSAEAPIHDRLSGVAGAHQQLLDGIAEIGAAARRKGAELQLHSVSLLLPETIDAMAETVGLAARLGACIHILQPFIAARANLNVAQSYFVEQDALVAAVATAARVAQQHGTRVKPYNIPYCWLDSLEGIEVQEYSLATHKRHQQTASQELTARQAQFFPLPQCPTCPTPCPGVRLEHYPREQMVAEILDDLDCYRAPRLVLPATDLLPEPALDQVLATLKNLGREIVPMVGGYHWCQPDQLASVLANNAAEVVLLLRTAWEDPEGGEPEPGNEDVILHLAQNLRARGVKTRLFMSVLDLPALALPFATLDASFDGVSLAVPSIWRGIGDNGAVAVHLRKVGNKARQCAENLRQLMPTELATFDNMRILGQPLALEQRTFAAFLPPVDWSSNLGRHRFTAQAYNFIMWGNPFWLF